MSVIFLSHSSRDDEAAGALREWLVTEGHDPVSVFLDHDAQGGIAGGEPWEERLYTELRRCRALVALVSQDWLASPWCVAEADHAQALRKPVFPLCIRPIKAAEYQRRAPPVLRRVQHIDWDGNEEGRTRLRRGLLAAGLDPKDLFAWRGDRAPYPGLTAFERADAAIYFGREQEITDLLALLRGCRAPGRPRLVLVQGASGTGKSSLLRAGVLPRLERDPDSWIVMPPFRPLRDPFASLTDAFAAAAGGEPPEALPMRSNAEPIDHVAWATWIVQAAAILRRRSGRPEATVLLSVDQLEEALAGLGNIGDTFLLALCGALATSDHRLLVIATLRADFAGALQCHSALREPSFFNSDILATRTFQLGPLPRAAFYEAIERPAALASLKLEAGLTARLVDEARTDDALPLLAFVLRQFWDRFGERNLRFTSRDYESFGGLEAAVGAHAERIVREVEPSAEELDAFHTMLVFGMAEFSADGRILRRRLPRAEVPELARRLVEAFAHGRLFVADAAAVEVAHEALFRNWRELAGWIEAVAADLQSRRRVEEAWRAWKDEFGDRTSRLLPPGRPLEEARELLARPQVLAHPELRSFVEASIRQDEARQEAEEAARQERLAFEQRARLTAEARQLAAQASLAQVQDPALLERSILLAVESMRRLPSLEADLPLRRGLDLLAVQLAVFPHSSSVEAAAWSPNGRLLACGCWDGSVVIHDVEMGREQARVEHSTRITDVALTRDGRYGASADDRGTILVWEVASGCVLHRLDRLASTSMVNVVLAFSPDGRYLAGGGGGSALLGGPSATWIWETGTGQEVIWGNHGGAIGAVAFSFCGHFLLIGVQDGTACLWDVEARREDLRLQHDQPVYAVAFDPTGQRFATGIGSSAAPKGKGQGSAQVWRMPSGEPITRVLHQHSVSSLAFNPDGSRLASASYDETARIWETETGRAVAVLPHRGAVRKVAFSKDGTMLATASGDRTSRLWQESISGYAELSRMIHRSIVTTAEFGPDDKLMTASSDWSARIWAPARGAGGLRLRHGGIVTEAAFDSDGRLFATATSGAGTDATARVWDAESGVELACFVHEDGIEALAFHPDGTLIATASSDGAVGVWSIADRKQLFGGRHKNMACAVAFSRDGRHLATGGIDGSIRIWDVRHRREVACLDAGANIRVNSLAFSPDGSRLATAASNGIAQLWDAATGRELRQLHDDTDGMLEELAFSPEGSRLITISYDARGQPGHGASVWCVESGARLNRLELKRGAIAVAVSPDGACVATASFDGLAHLWKPDSGHVQSLSHEDAVLDVAFSPDGQFLATASQDRAAHIWNVRSGVEIARLEHDDFVTRVAFSPTGSRIGTASWDNTARIWLWRPEDMGALACQRLTRNLTEAEWAAVFPDQPYKGTCPDIREIR